MRKADMIVNVDLIRIPIGENFGKIKILWWFTNTKLDIIGIINYQIRKGRRKTGVWERL